MNIQRVNYQLSLSAQSIHNGYTASAYPLQCPLDAIDNWYYNSPVEKIDHLNGLAMYKELVFKPRIVHKDL